MSLQLGGDDAVQLQAAPVNPPMSLKRKTHAHIVSWGFRLGCNSVSAIVRKKHSHAKTQSTAKNAQNIYRSFLGVLGGTLRLGVKSWFSAYTATDSLA